MRASNRHIELYGLALIPSASTFLLLLVCLTPKPLPGLAQFMPLLALIPVFYWGLAMARDIPYWFVFLTGLISDTVTGLPLGLSSLLYMVFLAMLRAQHKYIHKEGFTLKWAYFSALLAGLCAVQWLAVSLFYSQAQAVFPAVLQWFLTLCCFPFIHKTCDMLQEWILARRWQILHG